jgi:hypothetical protein
LSILWSAGDNFSDGVNSTTITVENSTYYAPCPHSQGRLVAEKRRGEIFTNGGPDIREIFEWTPREEFKTTFDWDDCGLTPPDIDCNDFPVQEKGIAN